MVIPEEKSNIAATIGVEVAGKKDPSVVTKPGSYIRRRTPPANPTRLYGSKVIPTGLCTSQRVVSVYRYSTAAVLEHIRDVVETIAVEIAGDKCREVPRIVDPSAAAVHPIAL